jgi:hypothetical protein
MSADDMEGMEGLGGEPRDLDPVKTLREKLEEGGLFVRTNQGARDDRGSVEIVYEAVVLGHAEVAEVIATANSYEGETEVTDPSQLTWDHVKERPEVTEGENLLGALEDAYQAFFDC